MFPVERAAKLLRGKLTLEHHHTMKLFHVAERGVSMKKTYTIFLNIVLFWLNQKSYLQISKSSQNRFRKHGCRSAGVVSCENQEQLLVEDLKVADSDESATQHGMEADAIITDR